MGMSYYRKQELGVERMMRELANRKPSNCSECGVESMYLSTQINPFKEENKGLNLKPRCQKCWKEYWSNK